MALYFLTFCHGQWKDSEVRLEIENTTFGNDYPISFQRQTWGQNYEADSFLKDVSVPSASDTEPRPMGLGSVSEAEGTLTSFRKESAS